MVLVRTTILSVLGAVCGTLIALHSAPSAFAAVNTGIYTGYASSCDSWRYDPWNPSNLAVSQNHYCWHFDEASPNQWHGALDLHRGLGAGDANQDVYWIQSTTSQSLAASVRFETITSACTGVRVILTGGTVGKFHYKHISPAGGINGSTWQNWYVSPTSVQGDRWLGTTAASQPGCPW